MSRALRLTEVERHVAATPAHVFAQFADGWLLPVWVVGAAHIRDVDSAWPQPGAKVQHKVGGWPLSISDSTSVLECEPPRRLVLQARGWPFGEARIELTVVPDGAGSLVRMGEAPTTGPGRWIDNPLQRAVLRARNTETLARLADLAQNRI